MLGDPPNDCGSQQRHNVVRIVDDDRDMLDRIEISIINLSDGLSQIAYVAPACPCSNAA
mgnify:FL=1